MIKILNGDRENPNLSDDMQVLMSMLCSHTMAAEIIAYKISDIFDINHVTDTFVQQRKRNYKEAVKCIKRAITLLDLTIDEMIFTKYYDDSGQECGRIDSIMGQANDFIHMGLLYYTRFNNISEEVRSNMMKSWKNFKQDPRFDFNELTKLFK